MKISSFTILSIIFLLISFPIKEIIYPSVFFSLGSILFLFLDEFRTKNISGTGSFIFGSFLFFFLRPAYILLEKDYVLFQNYFYVSNFNKLIGPSCWWSAAGILAFKIGSRIHFEKIILVIKNTLNKYIALDNVPSTSAKYTLLGIGASTYPVINSLANAGRTLYGNYAGAYMYDLPILIQSVVVYITLLFFKEFLSNKSLNNLVFAIISIIYFLYFTLQMRNISIFRGFYLTGGMILAISLVHLIYREKVGFSWIIVPFVVLQPIFKELGKVRSLLNDEVMGSLMGDVQSKGFLNNYWQFYSSSGDMNIFDTFVAAFNARPEWYPRILSWLYVPVHFIPRNIWPGKPLSGILQDVSFANNIPYSPGLIGYFLLDGGKVWMILSMITLGIIIGNADLLISKLKRGIFKSFLYAAIAVNALQITRFFLWQGFYQALYSIVPTLLVALIIFPRKSKV